MSSSLKPTVLLQLDPGPQPSVFDAVVAIDSGADHLLRHGGVVPERVRDLVHGAMFTRGPSDLHRTAIFVGGSNVAEGEALLKAVLDSFFDPFRVSVLFDASGANTTAAAALVALTRSVGDLNGSVAAVLGGTGPVGQRVARLLARRGAKVFLGSRSRERAEAAAKTIAEATGGNVLPFVDVAEVLDAQLVVSAGAAGVVTLDAEARGQFGGLKALVDLNAVPPAGIVGVSPTAKEADLDGAKAWGALAVGAIKMKVHRKALQELFVANDRVFDAEEVLDLALSLG